MIRKLFLDHPRTVEESYLEHMGVAGRFGSAMIWGGVKALVHAIVPAWCETSGSKTVIRLHDQLIRQRNARRQANIEMTTVEWMI
jgi:Family of unknown function (DUF6356)